MSDKADSPHDVHCINIPPGTDLWSLMPPHFQEILVAMAKRVEAREKAEAAIREARK